MCKENHQCHVSEHVFQGPEPEGCCRACLAMMTGLEYAHPQLVTLGGAIPLTEGFARAGSGLIESEIGVSHVQRSATCI